MAGRKESHPSIWPSDLVTLPPGLFIIALSRSDRSLKVIVTVR